MVEKALSGMKTADLSGLPEKEYFRIDQCVTKLEIENKVTVYGDISYTFPAYFGYQ